MERNSDLLHDTIKPALVKVQQNHKKVVLLHCIWKLVL